MLVVVFVAVKANFQEDEYFYN